MELNRFFSSIAYIESNLQNPIKIREAASASSYSEYHYSRIFKALVGDSPKKYIRDRRLSKAAENLINTSNKILDIAFESQFESQEAFTRAFLAVFDLPPAAFRKKGDLNQIKCKQEFNLTLLDHYNKNISMEPRVESRAPAMIVGTENVYKVDELDVLALWETFYPFRNSIPNKLGHDAFGIYRGFNQTNEGLKFTYSCCVEVSDLKKVPEGMKRWQLDEKLYAVFEHRVGMQILNDTLRYIWGSWLPRSKYNYNPDVDFEVYTNQFDYRQPEKSIMEIWIPIQQG